MRGLSVWTAVVSLAVVLSLALSVIAEEDLAKIEILAKKSPEKLTVDQFSALMVENQDLALNSLNKLVGTDHSDKLNELVNEFYGVDAKFTFMKGTKFGENTIQSPPGTDGKSAVLSAGEIGDVLSVQSVKGGFILTPKEGKQVEVRGKGVVSVDDSGKVLFDGKNGVLPTGDRVILKNDGKNILVLGQAELTAPGGKKIAVSGANTLAFNLDGSLSEVLIRSSEQPGSKVSYDKGSVTGTKGDTHVVFSEGNLAAHAGDNSVYLDVERGKFSASTLARKNGRLYGEFLVSSGVGKDFTEVHYRDGQLKKPDGSFQSGTTPDFLIGDLDAKINNPARRRYLAGNTGKFFYPETIQALQEDLQKRFPALGVEATGRMDGKTVEAIRQFQRAHSLDDDGVIGPITLEALRQEMGVEPLSPSRFERPDGTFNMGGFSVVGRSADGSVSSFDSSRFTGSGEVSGSSRMREMRYDGVPMRDVVAEWSRGYLRSDDKVLEDKVTKAYDSVEPNIVGNEGTYYFIRNSIREGLRSGETFSLVTKGDQPHSWFVDPKGNVVLNTPVSVGRVGDKVATGDRKTPPGAYPFKFGYGRKVEQGYFNENFPGIAFHPPQRGSFSMTSRRCTQGCVRLPASQYREVKQLIGAKSRQSGFMAFIAPETPQVVASRPSRGRVSG